jgi:hypothetical protein
MDTDCGTEATAEQDFETAIGSSKEASRHHSVNTDKRHHRNLRNASTWKIAGLSALAVPVSN